MIRNKLDGETCCKNLVPANQMELATVAGKASSAAQRAPIGRRASLIETSWNSSEDTAKSRTATTIRGLRVRSRPQTKEIANAAASGVKIPTLRQSSV